MFTSGTRIQIHENGTTKLVDELEVYDLVYDPLKRSYHEIADILKRTIQIAANSFHPLRPIKVKAGSVGTGLPSRDLIISPSQPILDIFGDHLGLGAVDFIMASSLVQRGCAQSLTGFQEVTYFAIFTQDKNTVYTEGMLTLTFSQTLLKSEEDDLLKPLAFRKDPITSGKGAMH